MLNQLTGVLLEAHPASPQGAYWVLDVHGAGLEVHSHTKAVNHSPQPGESLKLFTQLVIRETEWTLVGFLARDERDMFRLLQGASGVGIKVALCLLEALSVAELAQAVLSGQYKPLTVAKGVGPKLAQKILLELKEKMLTWHEHRIATGISVSRGKASSSRSPIGLVTLNHDQPESYGNTAVLEAGKLNTAWLDSPIYTEAESVLLSLGYEGNEVWSGLQAVLTQSQGLPASSELLLRDVLRWLSK